ncbi:MAG: peptidylprolyl isomerase [Nitrososphaerales archaeon]|nr:peptidylprolyl isomerase [Nitrososphaerales archaeon]
MPFEKGTLIFANYTAKVKDTGEAIESTFEDQAKKLNIYDANRRYEPRLIAVGEGWVISGLDDEIKKMDVGQKKEVELAPEKAFGQRDPTQTRMVPLRKFGDKAAELSTGDSVELDNREGVIRFIGSGRAQVDFNHRLAGKNIVYDIEILRKVETEDARIRALVDRRFGGEGAKVTYTMKQESLDVEIPEELFLLDGLQIIKRGVVNDVFKFVPRLRDVTFSEKFVNKKPEEKEEEPKTPPPEKEVAPAPKRKKTAPAAKRAR